MKTKLCSLLLAAAASALSACTLNLGSPSNTASTAPASNAPAASKPSGADAKSAERKPETVTSPQVTERTGGEQIRFAAGENSASLTRDVAPNKSHDFIINAKKGQKIGFQIGYEGKASDLEGYLSEPGLQDLALAVPPESRKEFTVKSSGDHRFNVVNNGSKKATFTLYVDIY